ERATRVEWAALSLSIALNCVGHWPNSLDATAFAALVGHALGPIGAAGTAYLISVVQDGIASADPWHLDDGAPAPSLMDVEEVEPEPAQSSTGVGDRSSFMWPVEPPSGARLLPIVAATEMPHGEAPVNLTGEAETTSPVSLAGSAGGASLVNLTGSTSEPAVNLTDRTGEPSPVNLTDGAESTSPVNLTGSTSEPRESKAKQRKRRTRPARRSTSPVNRKTVEERAHELDELIRSGELAENSSVNRVRIALRCSPENARKAIEWRREHLVGEVTGEPAERLTGEPIGEPIGEVTGEPVECLTGEPPVESGELVDAQTGEATAAVVEPHELTIEPALTAAR
ncbi:MAG UNVERIFIED_CONTAM: hypothetical protein LOD86_17440, partial [Thermobifida fusca]